MHKADNWQSRVPEKLREHGLGNTDGERERGKEEVRGSEDTGRFKVWRKEIEGLN